jgi:hypothetical protein
MHLLVFDHTGHGARLVWPLARYFLEGSGLGEIRKYPPEGGGPFAETASATIYRLHAFRGFTWLRTDPFPHIEILVRSSQNFISSNFNDFEPEASVGPQKVVTQSN